MSQTASLPVPPSAPNGGEVAPAFSPLYQQIKALIMRGLQGGEWKPGEAIPSELELAARFKVSQGTVRKAIDELATENLLVRRQGKGTFVATHAEQSTQYRFLRLMPDDGGPGTRQRRLLECRRRGTPVAPFRSQLSQRQPAPGVSRLCPGDFLVLLLRCLPSSAQRMPLPGL